MYWKFITAQHRLSLPIYYKKKPQVHFTILLSNPLCNKFCNNGLLLPNKSNGQFYKVFFYNKYSKIFPL